jgi:hypothetical protein
MDTMDFMDCPGKLPVLHFQALEFKNYCISELL